jgi:hypothetical protein
MDKLITMIVIVLLLISGCTSPVEESITQVNQPLPVIQNHIEIEFEEPTLLKVRCKDVDVGKGNNFSYFTISVYFQDWDPHHYVYVQDFSTYQRVIETTFLNPVYYIKYPELLEYIRLNKGMCEFTGNTIYQYTGFHTLNNPPRITEYLKSTGKMSHIVEVGFEYYVIDEILSQYNMEQNIMDMGLENYHYTGIEQLQEISWVK